MSNLLTEKPVVLVLVIAMIIILFVIGITPLKAAYKTLTSFDDSESLQLTQKKDACNKIYEKDENTKGDCALEVVALLIDQTGDYFQAHAFLMKQIKNTQSTQTNYEEAFKLAKELYPKSNDWQAAYEFYSLLSEKLDRSNSNYADEAYGFFITAQAHYNTIKIQQELTKISSLGPSNLGLVSQEADRVILPLLDSATKPFSEKRSSSVNPVELTGCSISVLPGNLLQAVTPIRSCTTYLRASTQYLCYWNSDKNSCSSCIYYQPIKRDGAQIGDLCTGYSEQSSCITDQCSKGLSCSWDSTKSVCVQKSSVQVQDTQSPPSQPEPTITPAPTPTPVPS